MSLSAFPSSPEWSPGLDTRAFPSVGTWELPTHSPQLAWSPKQLSNDYSEQSLPMEVACPRQVTRSPTPNVEGPGPLTLHRLFHEAGRSRRM